MTESLHDPGPAKPDTSDWTWVLIRPCPDCGFLADEVTPEVIPGIVRDAGERFAEALEGADVRQRPAPDVWSTMEYVCHVRDVCRVMQHRIELILSGDGSTPVTFADWDQDATANNAQYWRSDRVVVAEEVRAASESAAVAYSRPRGDQWSWPALRSNGSVFTAHTLGQYFTHDLHHHLWDIDA
jgi:hypothetical protein